MVLYRLPYSNEINVLKADEITVCPDVDSLAGRNGFVMIPYNLRGDKPILLFESSPSDEIIDVDNAETDLLSEDDAQFVCDNIPCNSSANSFGQYSAAFSSFNEALLSGKFEKLVLSRCKDVDVCLSRNKLINTFIKACRTYPRMMVYLALLPDGNAWLGCTPEIIVAGEKQHYRTMALAGTMSVDESIPVRNLEWSEKNQKEQTIVADYIRDRIKPISDVIEEEGPYTSRAGHLVHIKTEFHFSPSNGVGVIDVVKLLHPTPAVCGIPTLSANSFIMDNEGYDRSYYSGVVGLLNEKGETNLYVNLRCAEVLPHCLRLYAGGGILKESNVSDEWEETNYKMNTILSLL